MFFQIEAVFSFLFKYGQISHAITFLLRPAPAPVTPGSAWLRLTYLFQRSVAEVTECRFLTKWFRRGEQHISLSFFLQLQIFEICNLFSKIGSYLCWIVIPTQDIIS